MKLTPLSLPLSDSGTSSRSSGIHLSSILHHLALTQGVYPSNGDMTDKQYHSYLTARRMKRICGLAWEDWLAPRIALHYPTFDYHVGEFQFEDVIGSPDGISYESDGTILLHEIKHTRYSSTQLYFPEQKLLPWLWQCMGYLRMLSAAFGVQCVRAVLHPLFTDGDYRDNRYPQYLPTLLEFTWDEILANWSLVQSTKGRVEAERGRGEGIEMAETQETSQEAST